MSLAELESLNRLAHLKVLFELCCINTTNAHTSQVEKFLGHAFWLHKLTQALGYASLTCKAKYAKSLSLTFSYQVVGRLVGDVGQKPLDQGKVSGQLELDGLPETSSDPDLK